MFHNIELQEGAIIISDAHFSHLRPELLNLLQSIKSKQLQTTQLILMGDIFDALFGQISHTHKINSEIITLLNFIADDIEVLYIEGNHDFNLSKIFPKVKVFAFSSQPLICSYGTQKIALAHGDFDGTQGYKIYVKIIRNPVLLFILSFIDTLGNHFILKKLDNYLGKKNDCNEFTNFEEFIEKRSLEKYDCDYFIEGHYHQNSLYHFKKFTYINLAAFACNQRYFIVKSFKDSELLKEKKFS